MGSCCSCGASNKIVPLEDDRKPQKVTDNFVIRERGDGESLRDSDAEKSKNHSLTLDRHVSGSSFSSKSCASRSIDELDEDEDLLAYLNTNHHGREVISRYDMLSEVASDVKTEGGLTDVALDLDHPFAPLYEGEELDEAMLSRPRSVGLRGRSSYARDLFSQMSNCSDLESLGDHPAREDTPVPGKKGNSSMSILSKRKKKRGNNTNRSKRNSSLLLLSREDSDVYSTPRSNRGSSTPGSFSIGSSFTVRTDDGGSSLTSSNSSLSAIGEISEGGSASTVGRSGKTLDPVHSKQPRIHREVSKESTNKENVPPIPLPRASRRNPNAPRSADILGSEKEVEPTKSIPKSAESILGGRQDSTGSRSKVQSRRSSRGALNSEQLKATTEGYSNHAWKPDEILRTSTPAQNNFGVEIGNLNTYKPKPAQRQLSKSSNDEHNKSPPKPVIAEKPQILPKPASRGVKTTIKNFPAPTNNSSSPPPYKEMTSSPVPLARSKGISSWINSKPGADASRYSLSKPASAMPSSRLDVFDIIQERPMAARPRRPATAVENMLNDNPLKQKLPHVVSDELSDESMDDESHPDPPLQGDPKFRTIIII